MRPDGRRTKKLILAFHFQFSEQARWKCAECRRAGLEQRRGCALIPGTEEAPERLVWARKHVFATRCPKSIISAHSVGWIEEYYAWKLAGGRDYRSLTVRQLDAFSTLEQALAVERNGLDE